MPSTTGSNVAAGADVGGGLGGGVANIALMLGAAGKGGLDEYQQIVDLWKNLKNVNFDFKQIPPAQLSLVAEYFPELWKEVVPQEVKTVADSPEMRDAQARGVQRMEQISQQGLPTADRLAMNQIQGGIQNAGQASRQNVVSSMARRGQIGTGDELQARLIGNQQAMQTGASLGSDLSRAVLDRSINAGQIAGQQAGQLRAQDVGVQASNANIVNAFNEMIARTRNQASQARAADMSQANLINSGNKQRIYGETNPMLQNQSQWQNVQNQNDLKQKQYDDELARLRGLSGAYEGLGNAKYDEQAARASAIRGAGSGLGSALGGGGGLLGGLL